MDAHAVAQIAAANPDIAPDGADLLETIVGAAEMVAAAGYSPGVLAANPTDLIALRLLKQPGTEDYIGTAMDFVLSGLRRVAVSSLPEGVSYVMDAGAAGTFYTSPVRVATFEENAGQTNTSTVRIESNGLFLVQRLGAIAEVNTGS